jgi:hypothetical protein
LVAYYQCARAEIVQRVTNRDAAMPLFLVASGAVFGVAFGSANQVGLLYLIPAFGLGVSLVYSQHDHVIGAISRYLATEFQEQVKALPLELPPIQWDLSVERRGLKSGFRLRIATVTTLVTLPQAVAVTVADLRLGLSTVSVLGTTAGVVTIVFGVAVQLWVELSRQRYYEIRVDPSIAPYFRAVPAGESGAPDPEA